MLAPPSFCRGTVAALAVATCLTGFARAEQTIRLTGVPQHLLLPLPEGVNQVLTATVEGGSVRAVWLAPDEHSPIRVMLTRVEDGEYQINLAMREVFNALQGAGDGGQFQVFAETSDGKLIPSIPVLYALRKRYCRSRPELRVVPVEQPWEGSRGGSVWWFPGDVTRLELEVDEECIGATAHARAGAERWPFTPATTSTRLTLELTPDIRRAWEGGGTLDVLFICNHQTETRLRSLRAIPGSLQLDGNSCSWTVQQRASSEIPGSRGYLHVSLGDITGRQVMASISRASGGQPVGMASLREGGSLAIDLPEARYVLTVDRLMNFLIGDDHAVLSVSTPEAWEGRKIERLLEALEKSDVIFIREGQEYSGEEASAHLRRKLHAMNSGAPSLESFIETVGSRSSTTGNLYQVRLPDGALLDSSTWLRLRAEELFGTSPQKQK